MNKKRQYEKAFQIFNGTNHIKTLCDLARMYWELRTKEILSGKLPIGFHGAVSHIADAIRCFVSSFGAVAFDIGDVNYPDKFVVQKYIVDGTPEGTTLRFRVDCISGTIIEEDFD